MFETWENLGEHYANHKNVAIAEMNCKGKTLKICRLFGVKWFPTYMLFKNRKVEAKLKGRQSERDLINYIEDLKAETSVLRDET